MLADGVSEFGLAVDFVVLVGTTGVLTIVGAWFVSSAGPVIPTPCCGASANMANKKRPVRRTGLYWRLHKHLAQYPGKLAVFEQTFEAYERPNLHLAIEELLQELKEKVERLGVLTQHEYDSARLAKMARAATAKNYESGSVEYTDVPLADGRLLACIKRALFLIREPAGALALLVEKDHHQGSIIVEVMAADPDQAERFLRRLTRLVRHGRAFRGQVLSVEEDCYGRLSIQFHHLPVIQREALILPEELLRRIERHTIGFTRHAEKLRLAGRHLKRGLLLHGPPGTGKTLSAMYLASQMPG